MKIDLYTRLGDIATAPLDLVEPTERWYTTKIPKPVRFVLSPIRFCVCAVLIFAYLTVIGLPFLAVHKMYTAYKDFDK